MDAKRKAEIIAQGKKKGLRIQQNLFDRGYCVTLEDTDLFYSSFLIV